MTNAELCAALLAIVSLLSAAHIGGYVFQRFSLPRVGGEIAGGLLLGPTGLARFAPDLHATIFFAFPGEAGLISGLYWVGLILLMFVSGFHVRRDLAPEDRRIIAALTIAALAVPFAIGLVAPSVVDLDAYRGPAVNPTSFYLVFAIGFAVTSIPVISKIFIDLGLMATRFAAIVLATATVEDIVLWVALAVATAMATSADIAFLHLAKVVATTLLFLVLSLWLGPRILNWLGVFRFNLLMKSSRIGYVLVICFVFAAVANVLEVNIVFGALTAGIVVAKLPDADFQSVRDRISDVSLGVFVPIYFAVVGFKLDFFRDFDLSLSLAFLLASSAVKIGCVVVGARLATRPWPLSFSFAMAMNARGGPGIVLGSIAYEFGIIDARFLTALVLTAVLTSIASGMWLRRVASRDILDRA